MIDVALAVLVDWIVGDPHGFPHPVIYIGKLISALERLGRKSCRTQNGIRAFGGLIVIITASISFLIPFIILKAVSKFYYIYHILNILIIWTALAAKSLKIESKKVYCALENDDIEDARLKLSYIVGRETKDLSKDEIIRADVETVAENTSDGVIAPLLFAMIGGAPFAMLYKSINTMDSMLGYMNEKYRYIGFFPARVDDVFNFIPARITGILMCIVSFVCGGNMIKCFKIMKRDRKNHKSPNCAYPESAAAGALYVQLGGTNVYFGEKVYKPTIGDRIKPLCSSHIIDAIKLMYASETLLILIYVLLMLWRINYGR